MRTQDTPTYTRRVYGDRDFDLAVVWFAGFAYPLVGVTRAYRADTVGKNIPWSNGSGYRGDEANKLIDQAQGREQTGVLRHGASADRASGRQDGPVPSI